MTTAVWRIITPMVQEPSTPSALLPLDLKWSEAVIGTL